MYKLDQTCPNWIKPVQIGSNFLISIAINNTLKNNAHSSRSWTKVPLVLLFPALLIHDELTQWRLKPKFVMVHVGNFEIFATL